jgi:ribonuclease HI
MPIDPDLAQRLEDMIARLEKGRTLEEAARDAGVTRAQARSYLASLRRSLAATAKERPKAKKKTRKRTGPVTAVRAFADGGSRGNPGRAACAAIICDGDGEELLRRFRMIGRATNNVAEYEGVLLALELCAELGAREVRLRIDSELVVRQIEGRYKVKHPDLKPYHARVLEAAGRFEAFSVAHVRRKDNAEADKLVNAALDGKGEPGEDAGARVG